MGDGVVIWGGSLTLSRLDKDMVLCRCCWVCVSFFFWGGGGDVGGSSN